MKQSNDADHLPPQVHLLRERMLPGDVILTVGDGKFSSGIAFATTSPYSHAILVVSKDKWFEADDEGVGFTDAWKAGAWLNGPTGPQSLLAVPGCVSASVYRHPALARTGAVDVEAAITRIVEPWHGQDYSDYRRLFTPLEVSGRALWLAKIVLLYHQCSEWRDPTGMFCSEVIARVFETLEREHGYDGAAIFSAHRRAFMVHPGHLANSRLELVPDIVIDSSRLPADTWIESDDLLGTDRRFSTTIARQSAKSKAKLAASLALLTASVSENRAKSLSDHELSVAQLEDSLRESLATARASQSTEDEEAFRSQLEELGTLSREIRDHIESDNRDVPQFLRLLETRVDLQLRVRKTRVEMLDKLLASSREPGASERLRIIQQEREEIEAQSQRARQTFEELRKKEGLRTV